jgi:hypothetical protein
MKGWMNNRALRCNEKNAILVVEVKRIDRKQGSLVFWKDTTTEAEKNRMSEMRRQRYKESLDKP